MRLGSNAAANLLTGASSMVFQLALTAMAARSFDHATFSVWTLAISMAALTPLFAINLASVVTRQLVGASVSGSEDSQAMVVRAARRVALILAASAVFVIAAASVLLYRRSPELAHAHEAEFVLAVLVLTAGQLWQIGLQPSFGWHYAHERNWPVAGMFVLVRSGGLLAMWLGISALTGNFFIAALCVALGSWIGLAVAEFGFFAPKIRASTRGAALSRQVRETTHLAMGFAFWSLAVAAIQNGLPPLMSLLKTADYNAFYLAYSLNLVLAGVVGSAGAALLAPLTRLRLRGQHALLVRRLMWVTLACAAFLIITLGGFRVGMNFIVRYWSAGIADSTAVNGYLYILGFQTIARSMAIPFASILSSAARPMQLIAPSLLELGLTVCVAIPLGVAFGSKVFLMMLPAAGLAAAIATTLVATRIGGFAPQDRRALMWRFCAAEFAALALWQVLSLLTVRR